MIAWPSDKVAQGGVFHLEKSKYSKETEQLLKTLMDEAKLTNLQRSKIDYHLREGYSLPCPEYPENRRLSKDHCFTADFKKKFVGRRRNLDLIKLSGAYEKPRNVNGPYREPVDMAKKRLQEKMSGIKGTPRTARRLKRGSYLDAPEDEDILEQIQNLLDEVEDRTQWLEQMERLGQAAKYRSMIHNQITEKLRSIKRLEKLHHETELSNDLCTKLENLNV